MPLDRRWLAEGSRFPPTAEALAEPNGLLAAGGDLSPTRLLNAYRQGIFPWYSRDEPILWWTPSPRTVLIPGQVHCSQSMAKFLRKTAWQVSLDIRFEAVMRACAAARPAGTWIHEELVTAFVELHRHGYAHSIEVWDNRELIGGIYGVALGRVFFGESMFSARTNASKMALICLSRWLANVGFALIDAQIANPHLVSLGAVELGRAEFERKLRLNTTTALIDSEQTLWQQAQGQFITREGHLQT